MDQETFRHGPSTDPAGFIRENMRLAPVPGLPGIRLYAAHPASGLRRLAGPDDRDPPPPYWAYPWAGGMALARHVLDRPETVAGRRVLDLGSGSGLVAIAAAKAGAREVTAAETDPNGIAALLLNAEANGVVLAVVADDLLSGAAPSAELVMVGDLFYERKLAARVTAFLDRCVLAGIDVLVGDPGRAPLPRSRLRPIAEYAAPDFGDAKGNARGLSGVFAFEPPAGRPRLKG